MTEVICYNCKHNISLTKLFCNDCANILPPLNINHFTRLYLETSYYIDLDELEKNYLELQQKLHPDLFYNKSEIEKALSFKHILLINEAYEVLKSDLKRAEYILLLNKISVNKDKENDVFPTTELLEEIMELRMELEEAGSKKRHELLYNNRKNIILLIEHINMFYEYKKWEEMALATIKLKYLKKIADEII